MLKNETLYHQVVELTAEIVGPAAERFVSRQIEHHLRKKPEELKRSDIVKLVDWIKLSMSMLTDDRDLVDKYGKNLLQLSKQPVRNGEMVNGAL